MYLSSTEATSPPCSSTSATAGSPTESAASPPAEVTEAAAEFELLRSRLFGIACQVLGGAADAEDIVQEVWVRWQAAERSRVHDRPAFLVTITTRLALNAATSARARREISTGDEPPRDVAPTGSVVDTVSGEVLESALVLLVDRLSAVERAVYLLREAFDYPFRTIAEALEISEANARQLGRRARMHLAEQRHATVDRAAGDRLLRAFLDAAHVGAVARLENLLTADALSPAECGREVA